MILWRDYLAQLAQDGVTLDEIEQEDISEEGERPKAYFLVRQLGGRMLNFSLTEPVDPADEAPRFLRRRIANALRLPPEKYIFPDD